MDCNADYLKDSADDANGSVKNSASGSINNYSNSNTENNVNGNANFYANNSINADDADNIKDSTISDLTVLATNVLEEYGIVPESLQLVQIGDIKAVWRVGAYGRQYCLKRMKHEYGRVLFSVNAQLYIKNSGGKVPSVILNGAGRPITECGGQLFVLYEWIDGASPDFQSIAGLRAAVRGLAEFHIASKGYVPDTQSRVSTKLGKWPEQYASMRNKMTDWKEVSAKNSLQPRYARYLTHADRMISMADEAAGLLAASEYAKLVAEGSGSVVLCHQDYGKGNAIIGNNGVYVLDLDGVTFDLPARDLRKIIGKHAENTGRWLEKDILEILDWYMEVNPLAGEEIEVLLIDMLFPHWFFGLVKNMFRNGKPVRAGDMEFTAGLELSKDAILKTLLKRK